MGTQSEVDFRDTVTGRRQSWRGAKKHVKRVLGWRLPNAAMRATVSAVRPELRRTGRLPAPAALREVTGVVVDERFVMLGPAACVVAKELYWGKGRRPQAADDFAVRMFAALARPADVMLDIGAYTGLFTLVSTTVNPKLAAHAFEIVPEVYRMLFDNCVRNRVLDRTTLHHVGLGVPGSTVDMPIASGDSALPCYYSVDMHFSDGVPIAIRSLDSFTDVAEPDARVVMKVDVEGGEHAVFEYGQKFLAAHRPDILCEVLEHSDGARLAELLQSHGYQFHLVRDHDLAPAGELRPDQRHRDWLFTTRGPEQLRELGIPVGD
ncbi:FkbM family methyltransferase [Actinopolymorpha rutila]|uniref:FkbM family methyltransferase n=1 Tax=Actinopolymorpha rutila TaxID=446787 RepID=A0A852ZA13_9ACTN|nr:FkbM family methyltransferase [Actinopolymorpha rutila]